jgi:tetratricopeptide (TPR) repeat protein
MFAPGMPHSRRSPRPDWQGAVGGPRHGQRPAADQAPAFVEQRYLEAGQDAEALDDANRAIAIARADGIENLVSRGLIDLGNALFVKGRTAEALRTIQEALDIARRNGEKRSEARALVNLGSIRIQTGDMAQGWQDVQAALSYYRQGSFRTEAALALILLGRAARDKGDYEGAHRAFEETLATLKPAEPSLPLALAQEGWPRSKCYRTNGRRRCACSTRRAAFSRPSAIRPAWPPISSTWP